MLTEPEYAWCGGSKYPALAGGGGDIMSSSGRWEWEGVPLDVGGETARSGYVMGVRTDVPNDEPDKLCGGC
jgi:hypothetical protein